MKLNILLFLSVILGVCCMGPKVPQPPYEPISVGASAIMIRVSYIDKPSKQIIEVRFKNILDQALCIYPEYWPSQSGYIDNASNRVFLVVRNQSFPMKEVNGDYCPGCATYVEPGETISALIPYKAFDLPEALFNEKKHLEFNPKAFRCRKSKR